MSLRPVIRCIVTALLCCAALPLSARSNPLHDYQNELEKARKAFRENRPEDALKHLSKAQELVRDFAVSDKTYIGEAYDWINLKEATAALRAIERALEKNPEAAEAYYQRGYVYSFLRSNPQQAIPDYRRALNLKVKYRDPVDKNWHILATNDLWNYYSLRREFQVASDEFQRLCELERNNDTYLYYLGMAQYNLGSYHKAADAFYSAVALRPNDAQLHGYCTNALKRSSSTKEAILRYEELEQKHREPSVKLWLAILYLEDEQKNKAVPRLLDVAASESLDFQIRYQLAEALAKADRHDDAAQQYARVVSMIGSQNVAPEFTVEIKTHYGKSLIRAGKLAKAISTLNDALSFCRGFSPPLNSLEVLFELGTAHRQAKEKNEAELYFRNYLEELMRTTAVQQRNLDDVKTAETLGDLYLEDGSFTKAAEVYQLALETIKVLREELKSKAPSSRVQFKWAQALQGQRNWLACILAAEPLLADKEYSLKARRMLVHAYLETERAQKALENLSQLKSTPEWDEEALRLMGQALLAMNRSEEALRHIEEARKKQSDDEQLNMLYAQVLALHDRSDEAYELYQELLKRNPRSVKGWRGLGDLEMQRAKQHGGAARVAHLAQAAKSFKEARDLQPSDRDLIARVSQAERDLAVAEAEIQAGKDFWRLLLYGCGMIVAAALPTGLMWFAYRRRWAERCFQDVCALERDLTQLIRERVQTRWHGEWSRFADDPFRGRLDFRALRSRAEKEQAGDILAVANFGHLVGIIDAGWEALGFNELCAPEMVDPKEVIIANLSYVSSCRVCLAHVGRLEELTARHIGRGQGRHGTSKTHLSQHLHRQVKTSLRIIRTKFQTNVASGAVETVELPVLAPVAGGSEHVTAERRARRTGSR